MKAVQLFFFQFLLATSLFASTPFVAPDQKDLPIGLSPSELGRARAWNREGAPQTNAPKGPIHSLGEWEDSDGVMMLWPNASYVRELVARGNLKILADGTSGRDWWVRWLDQNKISSERVSYFLVRTDSIWVRDYGPWWIIDGNQEFGMIDTKYNRPRPNDDVVPGALSKMLGIPMYQPGLVHTGGNYYNDGLGNAFSSTLVFTENPSLSQDEVKARMQSYLGIDRYATARLAPGWTIEHLDTFGKLVAPDTFVFSDFPEGSRYREDSENYVKLLKTLKSPYGTPYKIFRMKMYSSGGGENFYAYLNSFISNRVLYYPTYGVPSDAEAKKVYQAALPGYEIVGVDAGGTKWGDSVHCRSRNLLKKDTLFIFPKIENIPQNESSGIEVTAEVIPAPGASLVGNPVMKWRTRESENFRSVEMKSLAGAQYKAMIPAQKTGTHLMVTLEAKDTKGNVKTAPINAPQMSIEFDVQ